MTWTTTLVDVDGGSDVHVVYDGIPGGVNLADNEMCTRMTLGNLAALVEAG